MRRGTLIVFEGLDGTGKHTQLTLLAKRLRRARKRVMVTDFPQYNSSVFGRLLKRFVHGELGQPASANPYLAAPLFSLDRFEAKTRMVQLLSKGGIILSNRYAEASKAHHGWKFRGVERKRFFRWLDWFEHTLLGLPKPDITLFFAVPPRTSRRLLDGRGNVDAVERHGAYQRNSYRMFETICAASQKWRRIVCVERGRMLSPAAIHERIWKIVLAHLK